MPVPPAYQTQHPYPVRNDLFCIGLPPLCSHYPGTTYSSIVWGMAAGDLMLGLVVALTMPCHDHYNYARDNV